jgi:aspartate/tyrosine/aromatic aminotransferase
MFLKRSNPDILKNYDSIKMKIWITNFFWSLHEEINNENGKESLPFESVSLLYKNVNLNSGIKELESIMKIVFQHNGVSLTAWQNWTNQFKKLKSFYGI